MHETAAEPEDLSDEGLLEAWGITGARSIVLYACAAEACAQDDPIQTMRWYDDYQDRERRMAELAIELAMRGAEEWP